MRVIGTAGHVDHGKSSLVAALTGTHPDRLKEEQDREMTIDLGFAWVTLPDGEDVGIVDVPGHRDFIENMLSGVGGIDAVLFVVAADEGVMPQTREHLAILDLLQIQGGVIALTKMDLVDDDEWLDLVEMDVRDVVQDTVLENAPILRVSARSGEGLEGLKQALAEHLAERPPRQDLGRPRLPVDRVFSISGFGTVVTGTLQDGVFHLGDEVEILPTGVRGRVRGLQSHKRKVEQAVAGSRTAVNISGVEVDQIQRGDVVSKSGLYQSTRRMDVHFRLLKDASAPLRHNTRVKLFLGAAEVSARVRLLGLEELIPGQDGWLQIETEEPVVAVRGDRYILRRPSPGETLGGGSVVEPFPGKRYKRFSENVLQKLNALLAGSPVDVLYQAASDQLADTVKALVHKSRLDEAAAAEALEQLLDEGRLVLLDTAPVNPNSDQLVMAEPRWSALFQKAYRHVADFHERYPLRVGIPREELKSRVGCEARLFNAALRKWNEEGSFRSAGSVVYLPTHEIQFTAAQQNRVNALLLDFEKNPLKPPGIKDCINAVGEEVYNVLVARGELVQVAPDIVFHGKVYKTLLEMVDEKIGVGGTISVGEFRDLVQTSRKYALAFLEHLDELGVTVREGDTRRIKKLAPHR